MIQSVQKYKTTEVSEYTSVYLKKKREREREQAGKLV